MGLGTGSTGGKLSASGDRSTGGRVIALAGNPNVGKSTVFNLLTGMRQHTGNWPGKTVKRATGQFKSKTAGYELVDIPGAYSLSANSPEEETAAEFICFGNSEAVLIVCDATCLERNLNLALQIMETGKKVLICVNMMDEAKKKGISIDMQSLRNRLGVPAAGICARKKSDGKRLIRYIDMLMNETQEPYLTAYPEYLEATIDRLMPLCEKLCGDKLSPRWLALKLLENDTNILNGADEYLNGALSSCQSLPQHIDCELKEIENKAPAGENVSDIIASCTVKAAEELCAGIITVNKKGYADIDRRLDKIFTGRLLGLPCMLLLLALVFYITIVGANYPSELLAKLLFGFEDKVRLALRYIHIAPALEGLLVDGVYRVLAWVVSVMLPPMAIFFPLFTLLEDSGYLPRVAYNLDKPFEKCGACGKQALTMCMGFGCNAAGVTGTEIISSRRERLIAAITNGFVPCNGRFPILIAVITMFFSGKAGLKGTLLQTVLLTALVLVSAAGGFLASGLLTGTVLKGVPSSYVLELPPYRMPRVGQVIVRSVFDRTLFVLGRAAAAAAPAGAILWLMANVKPGGESLMSICAEFLEPAGRFMGLDGVILLAFILGLPANEIVLPIIIMAYGGGGSLTELGALDTVRQLLVQNGWTGLTALCTMIFTLMHWPCATTLITVKKETGRAGWTFLSAALPTVFGVILCAATSFIWKLALIGR